MGKRAIPQLSYVAAAHYELPLCSAPGNVLAHTLLKMLLRQVIRAGLNNFIFSNHRPGSDPCYEQHVNIFSLTYPLPDPPPNPQPSSKPSPLPSPLYGFIQPTQSLL